MGDYDNKIAIIHSEKTAIILRGEILNGWIEGNQVKSFSERTTSIKISKLRIISAFQPLWGHGREEIELFRSHLKHELASSNNREALIIRGDFNAQIGSGSAQGRKIGRYDLHTGTNEAGEDLAA